MTVSWEGHGMGKFRATINILPDEMWPLLREKQRYVAALIEALRARFRKRSGLT